MIGAEVRMGNLTQRLARLEAKLHNPREANRAASVALYGWVIRNYDSEGGAVGGWEPVAPATARRKEALGKTKILVISGAMRASILPFYDDHDAGVGTPLTSADGAPYPIYHQEGAPKANLPQRRFLPDRVTTLGIGVNVYGAYVKRQIDAEKLK